MDVALTQAFAFTMIIFMGIILRKQGMVPDDSGQTVKKLLISVTLPAAIIINFSRLEQMENEMILMTAIGFLLNCIMVFVGFILTRNRTPDIRAVYMLCLPAFNIGAFCLPFIQSFLPAAATVTACMFDVGNSLMCTGGTYAVTAECISSRRDTHPLRTVLKKLVTSPPLMTYITMFLLEILGLKLPKILLRLLEPVASANTFMAMMMIGLLFHIEWKRDFLRVIASLLGIRHLFAILMAMFFYYVCPFPLVIRKVLVLLCFSPMSAVSPAYTGMCGGDEGLASAANSLSIILSIAELTALLILLGI